MKFRIHRETKELGGSCVKSLTEATRIVIDFRMPLVSSDMTRFDSGAIENLSNTKVC